MLCTNKSPELGHDNGKTRLLYDKEDILFFVVGFAAPIINLILLIIGSVIHAVNYTVNMVEYPDMESIILPYLAIAIQAFFGLAIIYRRLWAALIQLFCRIINLLASFFLLLFPLFYTLEINPLEVNPLKVVGYIKAASIFDFFVVNILTNLVLQIVMTVLTIISVNKLFKEIVPRNKIITYEKDHSMFLMTGLLYIFGEPILAVISIIIAVMPYILSLLFKIDDFKTVIDALKTLIGDFGFETIIGDFNFEKVLVILKTLIGYFKTEIIISVIYFFIRLFFGVGIVLKKQWAVLWVRTFMIIGLFVNFFIFLVRMASASNWIDLLPVLTALIYVAYDIVMIVLTSSIARIFDYDVQNYRMRVRDRCQ